MQRVILDVRRFARVVRWRRVGLVVGCVVVYTCAVAVLSREPGFREETIGSVRGGGAPVNLYIDEVAFDPVRQAISVRIDIATHAGNHGTQYGGPLDRQVELSIDDGDSQQLVELRRGEQAAGQLLSLDVRGAIASYPLDRYDADIVISARERTPRGTTSAIPIAATIWEGIPGWVAGVRPARGPRPAGGVRLGLMLRRSLAAVAFAVVLYALMAIVAVCSLCIGGLVYTGRRKVESTIVGALAAMVFSVAALRNVLPGGPPIGLTADAFVFLWSEFAVIAGLSLLVTAWVRRGPGV